MEKYIYLFEYNGKQIYLNTKTNKVIEYERSSKNKTNDRSLGTTVITAGIVAIILVLFKNYHITTVGNILIYIICIIFGIVISHMLNVDRQSKMQGIPSAHFTDEQWKTMILDIDQSLDNSMTTLIMLAIIFIPIIIWSFFKKIGYYPYHVE